MDTTSSPYRDFAENLRRLSADKASIAQVCRDLSMNRQQFNKYLAGTNLPGPATLAKIARYFGVEERAMFHYSNAGEPSPLENGARPALALDSLKSGVAAALARGLSCSRDVHLQEGCYHLYFPWIDKKGHVIRSMMVVFKAGELTCFRRYTKFVSPSNPGVRFTNGRHDGIVVQLNGRTFLLAQNTKGFGELSLASFSSTSLMSMAMMTGLAMVYGLSEPIATRVTLEYFGRKKEFRRALGRCGILFDGSPEIPVSLKLPVLQPDVADARIITPFGVLDALNSALG